MTPKIITIVMLLLLFQGCVAYPEADEVTAQPPKISELGPISQIQKNISSYDGKFVLKVNGTDNSTLSYWMHKLEQSGELEWTVNYLNARVYLPEDIELRVMECGMDTAYYSQKTKQIGICYEILESGANIVRELDHSKSEIQLSIAGKHVMRFALYHEIAHAFIDVLQLPITGKEEDAADELGTLMIIRGYEYGNDAALDGSMWLLIDSANEGTAEEDEQYSSSSERLDNVFCLVYGSNTTKYSYMLDGEYIPAEKFQGCKEKYNNALDSWSELIKPYYKTNKTIFKKTNS